MSKQGIVQNRHKGRDEEGTMVGWKDNEKKSSPFLRQSHDITPSLA